MDVAGSHLFRMALLRWLDILGVVLFVGSAAFHQLTFLQVLQAAGRSADNAPILKGEDRRRLPRLRGILVYLAVIHLVTLVHEAGMMSGKPMTEALPVIPVVLSKTHFGLIWSIKLGLLAALAGVSCIEAAARDWLLLYGGCLLCLTGSLSGHAIGRRAYYLALTDWLHYTAVSVWAGGLLPLRGTARRATAWFAPPDVVPFLSRLIETFSVWAVLCVVTITITGGFNAMIYLGPRGTVVIPVYGKVLLVKLLFVLSGFALGGFSRFFILPRLQRNRPPTQKEAAALGRLFYRALTVETGFVVMALVLAALLTQTPPPHLGP